MATESRLNAVGEFLRARRSFADPASVGLVAGARRRVTGLRREEVASLAGMSPDYYTRIEQGRATPSAGVLDALASALELDQDERRHLRSLANLRPLRPSGPPPVISESLVRLMETLAHRSPAFIVGPLTEVLAFNPLAEELVFPFSSLEPDQRNLARIVFLNAEVPARLREWDTSTRQLVALMRANLVRHPDNSELIALAAELTRRSEAFAHLWERHHLSYRASGRRRFNHRLVGELTLDYDALVLVDDPRLLLTVFSAAPDSPAAQSLQRISEAL